ncbi:MAG: hypothetical protein KGY81_09310 [Phycisphaerae bacterium]|nr:hypothetical protein [Phycisphaerae bacterium]
MRPEDQLTLGFFQRLITPAKEGGVDGMRELVRGDERAALRHLRKATHLADGAFAAGLVGHPYVPAGLCLLPAATGRSMITDQFT